MVQKMKQKILYTEPTGTAVSGASSIIFPIMRSMLSACHYSDHTFHARSVDLYNKFGGVIYGENLPAFKKKVKRILMNSTLDLP